MSKLGLLALTAFLVGCETPGGPATPVPAKPAVRTSGDDYRLPSRVADYELQRFSDFEEPEAGFMAKYVGADDAQLLDFFVYSARNLPAEISVADALWWEYENTKHQLAASLPQRGWKVSLAREEMLRVETKRGELDAVEATYQGVDATKAPVTSTALVALVGDDFVKMRATRIGPPREESAGEIDEARRAFFARLEARDERAPLEFETHLAIEVNDPACALVANVAYLEGIEKLLREGMTLHSLARETALLAAVAAFVSESEAPPCSGALADLRIVREAGFLREYVWRFRKPSFWANPGDLRLEAFEKFWREELNGRAPVRLDVRLRFKPRDTAARAAPAPSEAAEASPE